MMTKRLTENEIAVRIVPTHLRWPPATSVVWRRLHDCVQQLYDFARSVDCSCIEIEQNGKLGRDQIERQRVEIGQLALKRLSDFRPFDIAKQAATAEIERLQKCEDLTSQEAQTKQNLMRAVDELRGGIAATQRLLVERCKMRERIISAHRYY